jgi:hypothetical protein
MKKIGLLALIVLILPSVIAFGIMPAQTTLDHYPYEGKFKVVNTGTSDLFVQLSVDGDHADMIQLHTTELRFSAGQSMQEVRFTVLGPTTVDSTQHILVQQVPDTTSTVNFALALKHKVNLKPEGSLAIEETVAAPAIVDDVVFKTQEPVESPTEESEEESSGFTTGLSIADGKVMSSYGELVSLGDLAITIVVNALLALILIVLVLHIKHNK